MKSRNNQIYDVLVTGLSGLTSYESKLIITDVIEWNKTPFLALGLFDEELSSELDEGDSISYIAGNIDWVILLAYRVATSTNTNTLIREAASDWIARIEDKLHIIDLTKIYICSNSQQIMINNIEIKGNSKARPNAEEAIGFVALYGKINYSIQM
jgi:hypothetical protein